MNSILRAMAIAGLVSLPTARPSLAQEQPRVEYGSPADLAGVSRIFIDTGDDMDDHDNIAKIIRKKLPALTVTARAEDAEAVLVFRSTEATYYAGTVMSGSSETNSEVHANSARSVGGSSRTNVDGYSGALYETISAGGGRVFRRADDGRVLLIMSFKGTKRKGSIWKKPRTKFAEKFVESYLEGNPDLEGARH